MLNSFGVRKSNSNVKTQAQMIEQKNNFAQYLYKRT